MPIETMPTINIIFAIMAVVFFGLPALFFAVGGMHLGSIKLAMVGFLLTVVCFLTEMYFLG